MLRSFSHPVFSVTTPSNNVASSIQQNKHVHFVVCLLQHCCVVTNVATGWPNERNMLDQMLHPMLRSFGLRFTGENKIHRIFGKF